MDNLSLGSKDNQALGSGTQRKRKPTSRYLKDNASGSLLSQSLDRSKVTVVCNQTGKKMVVAVSKLSKEMGELTRNDVCTPGTQLLLDENGKAYPVTVISQGTKKAATVSKKQQQENKDGDDDDPVPVVTKKQQQRKDDDDNNEPVVRKKKQQRKDGDDDEPVVTKKQQQTEDDDDPVTRNKQQRKNDGDDDELEPVMNKRKRQRIDDDDDNESMASENDSSDADEPMLYSEESDEAEEVPVKRKKTERKEDEFKENIMLLAKEEFTDSPHKQPRDRTHCHVLTDRNSQCLKNDKPLDPFQREVLNRLTCIEKALNRLLKTGPGQVTVKSEEEVDAYYMYNGVNLLKVVAKDPIAYARNLLDLMFTKREQRQSLVLPSSKSTKPPLDQEKVTKLFDCVEKRYPKQYDMKKLLGSLNQKCRDAKPDIIID